MNLFANLLSAWMTVCAAGLLLLGLWLTARRAALWFSGEPVTGEIVRWEEKRDAAEPWRVYHHPVVRFPVNGILREHRSDTGGVPATWPIGSRVPVRVLPGPPVRAEIAAPLHFWAAPAGLTLFGLLLLAFAARAALA